MQTSYQVTGTNKAAPFTLKIHRGDGMVLLAMNWRRGQPPKDFAGFAIEYREPNSDRFFALKNRIGFPGQRKKASDPALQTTRAPIQKFRWVHFPRHAGLEGKFRYRVTPMFMNQARELSRGEPQEAEIAILRQTLPGQLNVAYTRGYVSSQAFVDRYAPDGKISTLIPDDGKTGLDFRPTHPDAADAYGWMGFEARSEILKVLDDALAQNAEVRVIAYDLNLPEILTRLMALGPRLRIIIDDSGTATDGHKAPDAPESIAEQKLIATAGAANVRRQHMGNLQHHKSIAVSANGHYRVVYGSTNLTWRGFYV